MMTEQFTITVPGSTSNLGAGFDSIGLALNLFLKIRCKKADRWRFIPLTQGLRGIPEGKDNMIYQSALYVAHQTGYDDLPPYEVELESDIPLARGLGSSGAAVAAGVELANQILNLQLSEHQKVLYATKMEGHPDNVAPSIVGGWVIAYYDQQNLSYIKTNAGKHRVAFAGIIPNFELETKTSRKILPASLSFKSSVEASAIANVSVAALFQEDFPLLGKMMDQDLFHQPYRKMFIPHYEKMKHEMEQHGAYGTFLSGAGPTMLSMFDDETAEKRIDQWAKKYPEFNWEVFHVEPHGLKVDTFDVSAI